MYKRITSKEILKQNAYLIIKEHTNLPTNENDSYLSNLGLSGKELVNLFDKLGLKTRKYSYNSTVISGSLRCDKKQRFCCVDTINNVRIWGVN